MKRTPLLPLVLVVCAGLGGISSSRAATLFSNLAQADDGDINGISSTLHVEASEFQTGALASTVTALTARVYNGDIISHTFGAYLYADSGSSTPGALLATFTAVDNTIGAGVNSKDITFSHMGINLAAGTRYWIALAGLESASSNSYAWRDTASDAEDAGSVFTNDSPPLRSLSIDGASSWPFTRSGNNSFALEGTLAPEPSRALPLAAGLLTILGARRRRPHATTTA